MTPQAGKAGPSESRRRCTVQPGTEGRRRPRLGLRGAAGGGLGAARELGWGGEGDGGRVTSGPRGGLGALARAHVRVPPPRRALALPWERAPGGRRARLEPAPLGGAAAAAGALGSRPSLLCRSRAGALGAQGRARPQVALVWLLSPLPSAAEMCVPQAQSMVMQAPSPQDREKHKNS